MKGDVRNLVMGWHDRAQIDYSDLYARLYIAYNAWYRKATRTQFEREALARLKKRFIIWDDYINGRTMSRLAVIVQAISELTTAVPMKSLSGRWNGRVENVYDWEGLLYFWYQVRCELFHGSMMPQVQMQGDLVRLAYESLNVYMTEICRRMDKCFTQADYVRLKEVQLIIKASHDDSVGLEEIRQALYGKYIHSPDLWNVDMIRV